MQAAAGELAAVHAAAGESWVVMQVAVAVSQWAVMQAAAQRQVETPDTAAVVEARNSAEQMEIAPAETGDPGPGTYPVASVPVAAPFPFLLPSFSSGPQER